MAYSYTPPIKKEYLQQHQLKVPLIQKNRLPSNPIMLCTILGCFFFRSIFLNIFFNIYSKIYKDSIYIYTHTHTHTHTVQLELVFFVLEVCLSQKMVAFFMMTFTIYIYIYNIFGILFGVFGMIVVVVVVAKRESIAGYLYLYLSIYIYISHH